MYEQQNQENESFFELEKGIKSSNEDKFLEEVNKELKNLGTLIDEIKKYEYYKTKFLKLHDKIFLEYQKGRYDFAEYDRKISKLLSGKTKQEVLDSYKTSIYNLLKRIDLISANLFMLFYNDKPTKKATIKKHIFTKKQNIGSIKQEIEGEIEKVETEEKLLEKEIHKKYQQSQTQPITQQTKVQQLSQAQQYKHQEKTPQTQQQIPNPQQSNQSKTKKHQSLFLKLLTKLHLIKEHKPIQTKLQFTKQHKEHLNKILSEKLKEKEQKKLNKGNVSTTGGSIFGALFKKKKLKFDDSNTKLTKSAYYFASGEESILPNDEIVIDRNVKISPEILSEEARRIKKIMKQTNKASIYNPSSIGFIANLTVSKISFYLLDNFPDLFKRLYLNLKLANIRILSNTYINIMVFFSLFAGIFGLIFSFINSLMGSLPILASLLNALATFIILTLVVFAIIYLYPSIKISDRKRSINANLTFAIDHMSAIAGSGIAPVKMFKLISESSEYGEISVELAKIVEYIELFGYDLITAIKSVSAVTPSPKLKEFFDGYISTIESGGNIEDYLRQKADEAMNDYRLQRQSYVETISTYSDVYTGILIAAPLFFIATLSLVNMLGGTIGGIDVDKLIVFGTYIMIPILNVFFLIFLQLTQPEI